MDMLASTGKSPSSNHRNALRQAGSWLALIRGITVNTARVFAALLFLITSPAVFAQQTLDCPTLPANSPLHWEKQAQPDFIVCKGITADGRAALSMMLSERNPNLSLTRPLRAEKGEFGGESLYWYRLDVGGRNLPGLELRRITVVKFDRKNYAQIWIDATDANELDALQLLTQRLRS